MTLQVCDSDFFLQTLPLLRESPDVALVRPACPAMPYRRNCTGGSPCWTPAEPCFTRISLHFEQFPLLQVLTPQRFGNVAEDADVFNHSNRHFWEVLIPGLAAWGMAVCTGSNLLLRASALLVRST